jgi:hypothetical protein
VLGGQTNTQTARRVGAAPLPVSVDSPTTMVELRVGKQFAVWLPGEGVERKFVRGVPARILKRDLPIVLNICGFMGKRGFVAAFEEVPEPPPPPVVPGLGDIVIENLGRR